MCIMKSGLAIAALAVLASLSGIATAETPAPATVAEEEALLNILPKIEIPEDLQPIPGALNEEFRNCEAFWPAQYALARSGPEARALRDIYGLVRARNVVATHDCTCVGKVANWDDVQRVAEALRGARSVKTLSWKHTQMIATEAERLTAVAETMCGGAF